MLLSTMVAPIYIPTNSVGEFPFFHILASICCFLSFGCTTVFFTMNSQVKSCSQRCYYLSYLFFLYWVQGSCMIPGALESACSWLVAPGAVSWRLTLLATAMGVAPMAWPLPWKDCSGGQLLGTLPSHDIPIPLKPLDTMGCITRTCPGSVKHRV